MAITPQMIAILQIMYAEDFLNSNIQFGDPSGTGLEIVYWNVTGVPEPSEQDILDLLNNSVYKAKYARYWRDIDPVDGLGAWQLLLEMLYEDLHNNTTNWLDRMGEVLYENYPANASPSASPSISRIAKLSDIPTIPTNTASDRKLVIATSGSAQSISGTSKVTVALGTEELDAASCFASNTFTAPSAGIYEFSALLRVDNAAIVSLLDVYPWQLYLTKNNSTSYLIDEYNHAILGAVPQRIQGTRMLQLAANDTIVLQVQKTLATALNINSAYFHVKRVSDL